MSRISLAEGKEMITNYKDMRQVILTSGFSTDILTLSETFDKKDITDLLEQTGCEQFRIYFGMDDDHNIRAILVGVDEDNKDILPPGNEKIMEKGRRCPTNCPPSSSLNS